MYRYVRRNYGSLWSVLAALRRPSTPSMVLINAIPSNLTADAVRLNPPNSWSYRAPVFQTISFPLEPIFLSPVSMSRRRILLPSSQTLPNASTHPRPYKPKKRLSQAPFPYYSSDPAKKSLPASVNL